MTSHAIEIPSPTRNIMAAVHKQEPWALCTPSLPAFGALQCAVAWEGKHKGTYVCSSVFPVPDLTSAILI